MFNWMYTDLVSLQDINKVNEIVNILKNHQIKFKKTVESTQVGLPNMYSSFSKPSPLDYDDSGFSKIYTICVMRKDIEKAKNILNIK